MGKIPRARVVLIAMVVGACSSSYVTGAETPVEAGAPSDAGASGSADGGLTSNDSGSSGSGDSSATTECTAQRVVVIVAGSGSLAWFTQQWAIPPVYDAVTGTPALDGDFHFATLATGEHPLYVRKTGGVASMATHGTHPLTTAMFAGSNETHTTSPQSTRAFAGKDVIQLGAQRQAVLKAPVRVLTIGNAALFSQTTPAPTNATSATEAASLIGSSANLAPATSAALVPAKALVDAWTGGQSYAALVSMATNLALTANAFAGGYVGTVLMPGLQDDPHTAFDNNAVTPNADGIASVLDHFYAALDMTPEPTCTHRGIPITLADNTVLIVIGDTYKNPFVTGMWPDGTPSNSNLLYVRSNGYLKPGFFGTVSTSAPVLTNFDPATGSLSTTVTSAQSTTAALLAVYFAITRGDATATAALSGTSYQGLVQVPQP